MVMKWICIVSLVVHPYSSWIYYDLFVLYVGGPIANYNTVTIYPLLLPLPVRVLFAKLTPIPSNILRLLRAVPHVPCELPPVLRGTACWVEAVRCPSHCRGLPSLEEAEGNGKHMSHEMRILTAILILRHPKKCPFGLQTLLASTPVPPS